ncbi:hypothetical protein QZH56_16105 [Streptomyces olivoreticuli]|uniref:hypothetical protein n=1 Tax=Streptomyces olivoreticuli TaxID=68246 RepID=UPI00265A6EAE|nr:hypothetical protein [Streptomyces olivoreticuli]WKK26977.1 hypothetical protein QZH56_16105 [Streptomyces olivoreticuli]
MFDFIRRAASWTRRQFVPPAGRHRQPTSATRHEEPAAPVAHRPPLPPYWAEAVRAEEATLVRPYVLTVEEHIRLWTQPNRRALLICPSFGGAVAL